MNDTKREERRVRGREVPLFRIAGIELRLDPSWFLIFLLILASLALGYLPHTVADQSTAAYWLAGTAATLLFFFSIVAHELSHALVAVAAGIRVLGITLFLFGGVSQMAEEPKKPAVELRVALVGPLTSFVLAAVFFAIHRALPDGTHPLLAAVTRYLAWINAALGVFNLLPGFPLDGGRVLRAILWWKTGSLRRATRIAADAGKGLAIGIMILGGVQIFSGALVGGFWLVLIGMFLRGMAEQGYQNLILTQTFEDVAAGDVAIPTPVTVASGLTIRRLVDDAILRHGYRAFPVVDDGAVKGLISIDDLKELPPEQWETTTVGERMKPADDGVRVDAATPMTDALKRLPAAGGRLLVMRGDRLVGMLTKSGLSRFLEIRQVLDKG